MEQSTLLKFVFGIILFILAVPTLLLVEKKNKRKKVIELVIVAILVAVSSALIGEAISEYAEYIDKNGFDTDGDVEKGESEKTKEEKIQEIRNKYYAINGQERSYDYITIDAVKIVYDTTGEPVKVEISTPYNGDDSVREYYIDNYKIFFACVTDDDLFQNKVYFDENTEDMLMFLDENGTEIYDLEEIEDEEEKEAYENIVNNAIAESESAISDYKDYMQ